MSCRGRNTFVFDCPVGIAAGAAAVGSKEGKGPMAEYFDYIAPALKNRESSWEQEEIFLQKQALDILLKKGCKKETAVDLLLGGDLIDQLTVTNFAAAERNIPFLGLYNACATMAEGMLLGASLIGGGFVRDAAVVTSSHNLTAERQYRFPTELGVQRPQYSQWTVTGAGSILLTSQPTDVKITAATVGRIVDYGITDPNEMGAAMAPAAADTLLNHFRNLGAKYEDYDIICTGDLGTHGYDLLCELLKKQGISVDERLLDGGMLIYDKTQDAHAGGSGAGCSAVVWNGFLLGEMQKKRYQRVLLIGTGALLSNISTGQGRTVPAIAHALEWEGGR